MSFSFKVYTTVDITRTDARRGDDAYQIKQMQNYLTVLQTIGLRVNPTIEKKPYVTDSELGRCYCLEVGIEFDSAVNKQMLENDFSMIPYIDGLEEFSNTKERVFVTKGNERNIIFCFDADDK